MKVLSELELAALLERLPGWSLQEGKLIREWKFADFVEAMAFVTALAEIAEAAGHHPDVDIRYNRVLVGLVTHDAGGVTVRDAEIALRLNEQFGRFSKEQYP